MSGRESRMAWILHSTLFWSFLINFAFPSLPVLFAVVSETDDNTALYVGLVAAVTVFLLAIIFIVIFVVRRKTRTHGKYLILTV